MFERRYAIVLLTALAALWMYIDRTCFSTVAPTIQAEMNIAPEQMPTILGAFFLTYALFQIPVGLLADRFGPRLILTLCIAGWSATVMAMSFAETGEQLLWLRYLLGVTEAGAFPAAAGLVRRWAKPEERGRFSSFVALGGRLGAVSAPLLTSRLAIAFLGWNFFGDEHANSAGNWRAVFLLFGIIGIAVAVVFAWLVTNDPQERQDTVTHLPKPSLPAWTEQLGVLVLSRNMWYSAVLQFCINFGWAFVITMLPSYLADVHRKDLREIGNMQTITVAVGACGMFCGGWLTDLLRPRVGLRWCRSIPLGTAMFGCGIAYASIANAPSAWFVVIALSLMAFLVDLSNPSIWAFNQDVGGPCVGAALGWGNMIGNIGAWASPIAFQRIAQEFGWSTVFLIAAAAFFVASICGWCMNASKPLMDMKKT